MNLDCIQIYPTNQYTPAVHRLLQVTANIYDATTTNYYPSVFRPFFWKTNEVNNSATQTCIYIAGYQYVQEPLTASSPPIFFPPQDVADPAIPFGLSATNNIYGIPWVLGVKKGLPNFNGLEIENYFFIERKLQFNRQNANVYSASTPFSVIAAGRGLTTNQIYIIGISNVLGIEDWNSYAADYTNQYHFRPGHFRSPCLTTMRIFLQAVNICSVPMIFEMEHCARLGPVIILINAPFPAARHECGSAKSRSSRCTSFLK